MEWEKVVDERWKLKDDNGYLTGWQLVDGNWFYLNQDGIMQTGWYQDNDKKWYYLREKTEDNVKCKGSMVVGWFSMPSTNYPGKISWYYASTIHEEKDNKIINCGEILTGWIKPDGKKWFYMSPVHKWYGNEEYSECEMVRGWVESNGTWYYLSPYNSGEVVEGEMLQSTTQTIDDVTYKFDDNGAETILPDDITDKGADFIGSWEGLYLKAYADPYYGAAVKDYWTIGYGTCYCSIPEAFPNGLNSTCTKEQARGWLKQEAKGCANRIKNSLDSKGIKLSTTQFEALLSFSYNCGTAGLFGSTLYNYICNGGRDSSTITKYFRMWNKANGQVSEGLDRRRIAEAKLFNEAIYANN